MAEDLVGSTRSRDRAPGRGREHSGAALAELRSLVRGIHPPVLAERGLGDALRALAYPLRSRWTSVEVAERLPAPRESALYFGIAEALANVLKHSAADNARITAPTSSTSDGSGTSMVVTPAMVSRRSAAYLVFPVLAADFVRRLVVHGWTPADIAVRQREPAPVPRALETAVDDRPLGQWTAGVGAHRVHCVQHRPDPDDRKVVLAGARLRRASTRRGSPGRYRRCVERKSTSCPARARRAG